MTRRQENEDELCARDWLRRQGHQNRDIRRPCTDPPDFVVDGKCAVEVTRLNQRIVFGDEEVSRGEEEARKPLTDCIGKVLGQLGPPGNEGRSWIVDFEYDFSNPKWIKSYSPKIKINSKIVANQISEALAPLLQPYDKDVLSAMRSRHFDYDKHAGEISYLWLPHLCLDCGICLELTEVPHEPDEPAKFLLLNASDRHGILLSTELKASIQNRILDKTTKIREQCKVGKYRSWWLILVDHICHAPMTILSEDELSFVRGQRFDFWSRVVVVSSQNPNWYYELLPR